MKNEITTLKQWFGTLGCSCDLSVGYVCPECNAEKSFLLITDKLSEYEEAFKVFICRKCGGEKQEIENNNGKLICSGCGEELEPDMTTEFIKIAREVTK